MASDNTCNEDDDDNLASDLASSSSVIVKEARLKARLEEAQNSLHHLQRSQEELVEWVQKGSDDNEKTLAQAIEENKPVLQRLTSRVAKLQSALAQVQQEHCH